MNSKAHQFFLSAAIILGLWFSAAEIKAVPVLGTDGHYYEVIEARQIHWDAANTAANAMSFLGVSGHLVTITSAAEDAFVNNLVVTTLDTAVDPTLNSFFGFAAVWAGGIQDPNSLVPGDGWSWVNGEGAIPGDNSSAVYANWATSGTLNGNSYGNQPDDNSGPGSERYLHLNLFGPTEGWNDGTESIVMGYVVEYDVASVIDAGSTALLMCVAILIFTTARRKQTSTPQHWPTV